MTKQIEFNRPSYVGDESKYLERVLHQGKLAGDGIFTHKCQDWFKSQLDCAEALMTPSCTAALELAALLIDCGPGDEIIMPSFTFVSTANAFALRGAKIVFVDVSSDTMNIDLACIEQAITPKTKAIVPVHYAGVSCNMNALMALAEENNLVVIEDAAQAVQCYWAGKPLGSFGHLATFSFHETKNYTCGEGGMLAIRDANLVDRAMIIREKGTNRSQFLKGEVDKYSWIELGSSLLPSELQAAYLLAQLESADKIKADRLASWTLYRELLTPLKDSGAITLPPIPQPADHNGHMIWILCETSSQRYDLLAYLKERGIKAASHYVPLHSSKGGHEFGSFFGRDQYTSDQASRLLRLPLYYGIQATDVKTVTQSISDFFTYKNSEKA